MARYRTTSETTLSKLGKYLERPPAALPGAGIRRAAAADPWALGLSLVAAATGFGGAQGCTGHLSEGLPAAAERPAFDAGPDRPADSASAPTMDGGNPAPSMPDASPSVDAGTGAVAEPFSFVVFGDNQFSTTSCTSGVAERLAVPEAIRELSPTFILHTGDLMDHGYEDGAYEQFESCYRDMLSEIPFFPTMGNHDAGYVGIQKYKRFLERQLFETNATAFGDGYRDAFQIVYDDDPLEHSRDFAAPRFRDNVPSGVSFETFYAFRYGNAYFVSFEVGTRWWLNTPREWLEEHLRTARSDPTIEHVFAYLHHPFYSTTMEDDTDGECTAPVRRAYEELMRAYDVTVVFSGHAHLYDRFFVPDDGHATRAMPAPTSYPRGGDAVHYLVTGGGGGPLNPCNPEREQTSYGYAQARMCDYHATHVLVDGPNLTIRVVGVRGSGATHDTWIEDEFRIE